MYKFRTNSLPKKNEIIDEFDRHSKYIVRIIKPIDIEKSFYEYGTNFYNAAHLISSYLLETDEADISELDTYFFALGFLYRHSLELLLKAIAFQTITNDTERTKFVNETSHCLEKILSEIEQLSPTKRPDNELDWLKEYLSNMTQFDKDSDSFRYPFHIVWDNNLFVIKKIFEKQTHIDLVQFANKFEAAFEILDKWYLHSSDNSIEWNGLSTSFIEEGGLYYNQSVVGYPNRELFYPYTQAYLETACYIQHYMKEQYDLGNSNIVAGFFIPMCYLYRNSSELSLKTIWFEETGVDLQTRCKMMLDRKHSIEGIWNLIKPYAEDCITGENDTEYLSNLENYCKQLQNIDCDANKFRYPVQNNMLPYFNKNKCFDFLHTGTFFEAIINAVDGIVTTLNNINEYKAEMEAEYRSEMLSYYNY